MKLGIFAKTFEGSEPASVMHAAKQAGFSEVQYNMACSGLASMPDRIDVATALAVHQAAQRSAIKISAVSATYNMIHPDLAVRELGLQRLDVIAARCAELGTSLITLCTGTRHATDQWQWHVENESQEAWRDLTSEMAKALTIAERHNVNLGIEPELANVVNSASKAKILIDQMKSSRLKIIFDAANLFEVATMEEQRTIISSSIDLLAPHIVVAHAKDRMPDGAFTVAGQGCLDYGHYIACLTSIGFEGALVTHGLTAADAMAVSQFLKGITHVA